MGTIEMATVGRRQWLLAAAVLIAIVGTAGMAAATLPDGPQQQVADCTASPTSVAPGETVTLDASASDAFYVEFDKEGDGEYERIDETDFIVNVSYANSGTYDPVARADGENTDLCGQVTVNERPSAALSVSPNPAVTSESVTFDASASTDTDGNIVEFRWDFDGDGSTDRTTETSTTDFTYSRADTYLVSVTVVDDDGAHDTAERELVVEANVVAECTVDPSTVAPGEFVTIDATGSQNAELIDYDTDGDGEYEILEETTFSYDVRAPETSFTPSVRVYTGDRSDTADCGTVTVEEQNEPPRAAIAISPRPGVVGQTATLDASNSTDPDGQIVEYRWDFDGNGTIDQVTGQATTTHVYSQATLFVPTVTVVDDDNATSLAANEYDVREPRPELRCTVEPTTATTGEEVRIDARESSNVDILDFDIDGDEEYERPERTELATTVVYEEPGTYEPRVRHRRSEQVEECGSVDIDPANEPPIAAFTVDPRGPTTGETVTFNATNSTDPDGRIVRYVWDFDNDGTTDRKTSGPLVQYSYNTTGAQGPTLRVVDDDGANDTTGRDLFVEEGGGAGGDVPWVPIGLGGGGLIALGGLAWYVLGGGGMPGGGSGGHVPKPKPRPDQDRVRYETGVFALPTTSGSVSVPIGFEPDLVLFNVLNGARTDRAVDRTAGMTTGLASRTGDGLTNQCLTVADDANTTDQATCATNDDLCFQLVRHAATGPPGRVTGRVGDTTSDGFELDVTVPGDDPLAGGVRLLYQAFSTTSDVDVEVGLFRTPTEPGTQTVPLGIDPDHLSLTTSSAVSDTDQLWTTNRGAALSIGNAVAEPSGTRSQTVWGTSAWPEFEHTTAAVGDVDRAIHLLYQDGDRIAGRTRASITDVGQTLRLQYDRVYNGPHKLGSTARHPVSYLAMAGGEAMRPAVGAFPLPEPGETISVDCGFEPAMVELHITGAPLGEEVARGAGSRPYDVSHGTAIDTGDGLRQYVLHHAVVTDPPATRPERTPVEVQTGRATRAVEPATDGGNELQQSTAGDGTTDTDVPVAEVPETDADTPGMASAGQDASDGIEAPAPAETPDDGRIGQWLAQAPDGTVLGRDELRVQGLTATGFDLSVGTVSTDRPDGPGTRPAVVYRAWPAVDGERTDDLTSTAAGPTGRSTSESDGNGSPADGQDGGSP